MIEDEANGAMPDYLEEFAQEAKHKANKYRFTLNPLTEKINLFITAEQLERLTLEARRRNASLSGVVRVAIDFFINEFPDYEAKRKG